MGRNIGNGQKNIRKGAGNEEKGAEMIEIESICEQEYIFDTVLTFFNLIEMF